MPLPSARVGDLVAGIAPILFPAHINIQVNGIPAAMPGSFVTPHFFPNPHIAVLTPIIPTTVLMNGLPARTIGDFASCGDVITTGAPNVLIT